MGPCILICKRCHVLNNKTLMNHFPFGREKEKKHSSSAWHHTCTAHSPWQERTQITANSPKTSAARICTTINLSSSLTSSLSLLSFSLAIFLALTIFLSMLCGSYFSSWRAGRGSKYPAPQTADPQWPCNLRVSDASPKVSHSKAPVLQHSGCSTDPVIHQPARSPARSYWFLFPQSPGEGERKD